MKTARSTDVNSNRRFKTDRYEGGKITSATESERRERAAAKDGSKRLLDALVKMSDRLSADKYRREY